MPSTHSVLHHKCNKSNKTQRLPKTKVLSYDLILIAKKPDTIYMQRISIHIHKISSIDTAETEFGLATNWGMMKYHICRTQNIEPNEYASLRHKHLYTEAKRSHKVPIPILL